jgi:hypothetical protein
MRVTLILLLLITSASLTMAQESRPIVNDDIVQLSRAGVMVSVVIEKIKTSQCKFDTSPSALVALKQAGVADEVLMEMVRHPNGEAPSAPPPVSTKPVMEVKEEPKAQERPEPGDSLPEYGDISEIRRMRRVYVIADDIDSQNLLNRALQSYEGLDVVSSPDRAEIFVAFGQASSATGIQLRGLFAGTIDHRTKAQFIVFYRGESGRRRIVFRETEDIQTSSGMTLSRSNEVNVVRHFVKALTKVRSE